MLFLILFSNSVVHITQFVWDCPPVQHQLQIRAEGPCIYHQCFVREKRLSIFVSTFCDEYCDGTVIMCDPCDGLLCRREEEEEEEGCLVTLTSTLRTLRGESSPDQDLSLTYHLPDLTLLHSPSEEQQVAEVWRPARAPPSRGWGWAGRTTGRAGTASGGRTWRRPSEWRTRTWKGRWNDLSLGSLGVWGSTPRGPRLEGLSSGVIRPGAVWTGELERVRLRRAARRGGRRSVEWTSTSPGRHVSAGRPVTAPSASTAEPTVLEMTSLTSSEASE